MTNRENSLKHIVGKAIEIGAVDDTEKQIDASWLGEIDSVPTMIFLKIANFFQQLAWNNKSVTSQGSTDGTFVVACFEARSKCTNNDLCTSGRQIMLSSTLLKIWKAKI